MQKLIGIVGLAAAALLVGCGGGGGSPGETREPYQITLRADRNELPVNIEGQGPGIGAWAPYTTTLYVNATAGGRPIPNGEEGIFACNVAGGLGSGPLYYLDGDDEHETEVDDGQGGKIKIPNAYRNITLGSNAGGNSFHFHAGDQAGTTRVTCTVTDPGDKRVHSASVDITVGAATGRPASVIGKAQAPGYLGSQNNPNNVRNNVGLQAFVMDDANQPVSSTGAASVQIRILPSSASTGARLLLGQQSGSVVQAQALGGVALFSLSSGPSRGVILLELSADRQDNNVSNGIQDPIVQWAAVPVVDGVSATPLAFAPASLDVTNAAPFGAALTATGGTPPYAWAALGPLPGGLTLSSLGVISGTPVVAPGTYAVPVRVTDALGASVQAAVTIKITGPVAPPLVFEGATVTVKQNQSFSFALTASGGDAPYSWAQIGTTPPGLNPLSPAGVLSGTPTQVGSYLLAVRVTDGVGQTVNGNVTITVEAP